MRIQFDEIDLEHLLIAYQEGDCSEVPMNYSGYFLVAFAPTFLC